MDDLRIEPSPGSRDGIRVLKLIGPFTLKHVFEFQEAVRHDPARLTIIDLTAVPKNKQRRGAILDPSMWKGYHVRGVWRSGVWLGLAQALRHAVAPLLCLF